MSGTAITPIEEEESTNGDNMHSRNDKSTGNSAVNDENSWVLDSVVGFLKSPVWNVTIQAFIEQKSVVFEPENEISEESAQEYRLIYEDYKNLVDRLLSGHMFDLGIGAQQFEEACHESEGLLANKFRRVLFEQIWAANDYQIFVRFMTQRNIELQLQALEVLAQRYGLVYDSFVPLGANREDFLNDEVVIKEAIKRSLAEEEGMEGESDRQEMVNTVNIEREQESIQVLQQKNRLVAEHEREQERLSLAIQSAMTLNSEDVMDEPVVKTSDSLSAPVIDESIDYKAVIDSKDMNKIDVKNESINSHSIGTISEENNSESIGLSSEEIHKRTEYLRKQRDKLLSIKTKERNKQLVRMEEQELLAKRPKSAKAMRSVVDLNTSAVDQSLDSDISGDQSLAFRRSLAARLKAEVIEQQKNH